MKRALSSHQLTTCTARSSLPTPAHFARRSAARNPRQFLDRRGDHNSLLSLLGCTRLRQRERRLVPPFHACDHRLTEWPDVPLRIRPPRPNRPPASADAIGNSRTRIGPRVVRAKDTSPTRLVNTAPGCSGIGEPRRYTRLDKQFQPHRPIRPHRPAAGDDVFAERENMHRLARIAHPQFERTNLSHGAPSLDEACLLRRLLRARLRSRRPRSSILLRCSR